MDWPLEATLALQLCAIAMVLLFYLFGAGAGYVRSLAGRVDGLGIGMQCVSIIVLNLGMLPELGAIGFLLPLLVLIYLGGVVLSLIAVGWKLVESVFCRAGNG